MRPPLRCACSRFEGASRAGQRQRCAGGDDEGRDRCQMGTQPAVALEALTKRRALDLGDRPRRDAAGDADTAACAKASGPARAPMAPDRRACRPLRAGGSPTRARKRPFGRPMPAALTQALQHRGFPVVTGRGRDVAAFAAERHRAAPGPTCCRWAAVGPGTDKANALKTLMNVRRSMPGSRCGPGIQTDPW